MIIHFYICILIIHIFFLSVCPNSNIDIIQKKAFKIIYTVQA